MSLRSKAVLRCRGRSLSLSRTLLMGVVNVTPDSFSDGGRFLDPAMAVSHAKVLLSEGADILDVGAESTRPGSDAVSEEQEWSRLEPVLRELVEQVDAPISVDTCKPGVARRALDVGVHLINDVTGLTDPAMAAIIASYDAPVVIMHMKGRPKTMQRDVHYDDVVGEVKGFLVEQAERARQVGIEQVIIDPGIGFGKNLDHNLRLLKHLDELAQLPYPLLVGSSRKSFIGAITGAEVGDRLEGTLATVTAAVLAGANLVRVHDVKQCRRAVLVAEAIRGA